MTYLLALVSDFIDFKIGATEKLRRQLLDGETDGIGCAYKSFVPKWLAPGTIQPPCCNRTTRPRLHDQRCASFSKAPSGWQRGIRLYVASHPGRPEGRPGR